MAFRTALLTGVLAAGLISAVSAAPANAQVTSGNSVSPNSVQSVCAQDVYVRNQPAGVVIGTLVRGDNFDHQRSDSSGVWWYGHAYGNVHLDGWVLGSAFSGC